LYIVTVISFVCFVKKEGDAVKKHEKFILVPCTGLEPWLTGIQFLTSTVTPILLLKV
jgi:hypothetical protein